MPPLLDDNRVRLNYENLENNRIKPVTIILTEEEKRQLHLQRSLKKLTVIMYSRLRRARHDRTSRTKSST